MISWLRDRRGRLPSDYALAPFLACAVLAVGAAVVLTLAAAPTATIVLASVVACGLVLVALVLAETLRRRNKIIAEALDATLAPFVVYDPHDRLILSNKSYHAALGLPSEVFAPGISYEDIVRRTLEKSVPPDRLEFEVARRCSLQRAATGIPSDRRYPDGVWFRVTKTRTRSGANVGIAIDVTELYTLKARLQAEAERFSALANNSPVGICQLADGESGVRFVNDALLAMLGVMDRADLFQSRLVFLSGGKRLIGFTALVAELGSSAGECDAELRLPSEARTFLVKKALLTVPSAGDFLPDARLVERILIFVDITDRKRAEEKIQYLAMHDSLTGAGNRAAFSKAIEEAASAVTETSPLTLVAIDLDRFKPVNDTYGHAAGDEVLKQLSGRIRDLLAPSMSLYRMGGDEFTIVCRPDGVADRAPFAHEVLQVVQQPIHLGQDEVTLGASIGLSSMPDDTDDAKTLLHYADLASYRAKRGGGGRIAVFHDGMLEATDTARLMEFELNEALSRETFEVVYQPQYGKAGGAPCGVEAFVRWRRKRTGALIKPRDFLELVRKHNLIERLDLLVMKRAVAEFAGVMDKPHAPRTLSLNVSEATLQRVDALDAVGDLLAQHKVPANRLVFEINEVHVAKLGNALEQSIGAFADKGVGFVLDDFGSGSTSFRLLTELPLCGIKVDGRALCSPHGSIDPRADVIAKTVGDLAQGLGIAAIAGGIETREALALFARHGFCVFQGHHLGSVGPRILPETLPAPLIAEPNADPAVASATVTQAAD